MAAKKKAAPKKKLAPKPAPEPVLKPSEQIMEAAKKRFEIMNVRELKSSEDLRLEDLVYAMLEYMDK